MRVRPVMDKGRTATSTNGFTVGGVYEVIEQNERGSLTVINDNGHERSVSLGCPSPHLVWDNGRDGFLNTQKCVGHFEEVDDDQGRGI